MIAMWRAVFLTTTFIVVMMTQAAPVTISSHEEDMRNRYQIALECINQVQIDRKIIEEAIYNPNPDELPTSNKYKQFLACSYKKQNFQSQSGDMLFDNIYDFLTRFYNRTDLKILDRCKNIKAENDGETAYSSLKCILQGLHKINAVQDS